MRRFLLAALASGACAFPPADYTGRACAPDGTCPAPWVCNDGHCALLDAGVPDSAFDAGIDAGPDAGFDAGPPACTSSVGGPYCAGDKVANGLPNTLYQCGGVGPALCGIPCASGCVVEAQNTPDACAGYSPGCPGPGTWCGGDQIGGDPRVLYDCTGVAAGHPPPVSTVCCHGCHTAGAGTPDSCNP